MTDEEYQKIREFRDSPLGRALTRFENAVIARHTYEGGSVVKAKRLDDEYNTHRTALIALFKAEST